MMCVTAKRSAGVSLVLALALGFSMPAQAKVLAKVNGVEITDEDVKVAIDDIGAGLPQQIQGAEREAYVLDYLIDLKLVARAAEAKKMAESAEFARRMTYQRDKALMEGLLGDVAKEATTDVELKKVYDEARKPHNQQKIREAVASVKARRAGGAKRAS